MKREVDFKLMRKAVDMRLTKSMEKAETRPYKGLSKAAV